MLIASIRPLILLIEKQQQRKCDEANNSGKFQLSGII